MDLGYLQYTDLQIETKFLRRVCVMCANCPKSFVARRQIFPFANIRRATTTYVKNTTHDPASMDVPISSSTIDIA